MLTLDLLYQLTGCRQDAGCFLFITAMLTLLGFLIVALNLKNELPLLQDQKF
jgi:hypothetical protein